MFEFALGFGISGAIFWALRALWRRNEASSRARYRQFLQEDKQTSTLEYVESVTRERQDSRVWR